MNGSFRKEQNEKKAVAKAGLLAELQGSLRIGLWQELGALAEKQEVSPPRGKTRCTCSKPLA